MTKCRIEFCPTCDARLERHRTDKLTLTPEMIAHVIGRHEQGCYDTMDIIITEDSFTINTQHTFTVEMKDET